MLLCCHVEYDSDLLTRIMALSLPERRKKAQVMRNEKIKASSLAAGLLLKYGLQQCGVVDYNICYAKNGKPYLNGYDLCFSLSHSGDYAACIIDNKPVGVDIQKIVAVSQRAVLRFCTEVERQSLNDSCNYRRDVIRLWALKESWLKATGKNASDMFNASFTLHEDGTADGPEGFKYRLYESIPDYILAVCERE
ncbi:MAG: 4'-phosphopantetheinyl transferase superfamily protein [Candidatus Fimivivens sp.]|nr:4'-phosphopantetheinyl transferase superfamily protein [Candidatus Fimivivens sp.]